jgi:MFS family permease
MEKPVWMICITHMFLEIYLLIQVALIPVIASEFQLSLLEASLVASVPSLVMLLMNIPCGFLADHFSTNHLLFSSMLIEGFSALLISQTNSFWTLVLGVSLMKIASPVYHISGLSQISRFARKPKRIGRAIGLHNALGSLGAAVGVVSLAVFLATLGWRWSYLFWALPILVWGFIVLTSPQLRTKRIEQTKIEKRGSFLKFSLVFSVPLLIFLVSMGAREVGSTGISTFMTTYKAFRDNSEFDLWSGAFLGDRRLIKWWLHDRKGRRKEGSQLGCFGLCAFPFHFIINDAGLSSRPRLPCLRVFQQFSMVAYEHYCRYCYA